MPAGNCRLTTGGSVVRDIRNTADGRTDLERPDIDRDRDHYA